MSMKKFLVLVCLSFLFSTATVSAQVNRTINLEKPKISNAMLFDNGQYSSIYYESRTAWLKPTYKNIWIESKVKRKGQKSLAFKLNPNEKRIETKVASLSNNTTHFMKFSVYFHKNYKPPTHWNLFAQWWQGSPASPPVAFQLDTHSKEFKMEIIVRDGTIAKTNVKEIYNNSIPKNKWIDFIIEMRIDDTGGKKGILKVWKDGKLITNYKGKLGYTDLNDFSDFKVGLYRARENNYISIAYFDEIKVSNTFQKLK